MLYKLVINGLQVDAVYRDEDVENIFLPLLRKLTDMQKRKGKRILVLLAAPPGAGKSTLVSFLELLAAKKQNTSDQSALSGKEADSINQCKESIKIQVIGMDGFHRRQAYLTSHTTMRGGEEISMARIKGAPETFDLEALSERLGRVAAGEKCGWPIYDRRLHDPVDNAITVDGDIVILEGNYLLLDNKGWRDLRKQADYTVFIRADEDMLRRRLTDRKALGMSSYEEAERFVEFSDLRNVQTCLKHSTGADLELFVDADSRYSCIE